MKSESIYPKHIVLFTGVWTAVALIVYFLLMRLAGLAHIMELRLFNFVILVFAVRWVMKLHAKITESNYNYFETLGIGCETVIVAVVLFSIFIFTYLSIDHEMMTIVKQNSIMGNFLNPETAAIGVAVEGLSSGMIMAYIYLSYLAKPSRSIKGG
jgi:hypothetical protein